MARAQHKKVHAVCPFGADTWAACDKAVASAKADWDAMQQVILAYNIAGRGGKKFAGKDLFAQLVRYIRGDQIEILNDEGNPHIGPWALRLRSAIERFKAGDIPVYCLYQPVLPASSEGG